MRIIYSFLLTVFLTGTLSASPEWTISPGTCEAGGLHLAEKNEAPGLYFISQGISSASIPWIVGTEPFEFQCSIEITKGREAAWRWPGVAVSIASGIPGSMGDDDIALSLSVHQQGIICAVRKSGLYRAGEKRPNVWHFQDASASPRYILNMGGAGGHDYSLKWPTKSLAGTRVHFQLRRDTDNALHFSVWYENKIGTPWWTGTWQLPQNLARIPLRHLSVTTVLNPNSYKIPALPIREVDEMRGRIFDLRGRILSRSPDHNIAWFCQPDQQLQHHYLLQRLEPREASPEGGDEVVLVGNGFDENVSVTINQKPAAIVSVINKNRLQIRVPPGVPGPANVTVKRGSVTFKGSPSFGYAPHPHLWFTSETLNQLKDKFTLPQFKEYRRLILDKATAPRTELGRYGAPNHAAIIHAYLWAYLLRGERRYEEKLEEALEALLTGTDELPRETHGAPGRRHRILDIDEFMCHNAEAVATVYDALFKELTPEKRSQCIRYLDRHLDYYRDRIKAHDWWYANNPSNTVAVGNGCLGITALALRYSTPPAEDLVTKAVETISSRYRGIADDGGCIEGALYWDYGFTYQLLFGHALKTTTGDDRGLLSQERIKKVPEFVKTQLGGSGRFFTFNDTQPWLTGAGVCASLGSQLDNNLLRWLADKTIHEAATGGTEVFTRPQFYAFAFRARDLKPAPAGFPGVPLADFLPVLNWGVLRSDNSFTPGLVVGVKGRGGATTHHAQEDAGGFVIDARGESLLIDPGYYQGKATAHSVLLFEGKGPHSRGRAAITKAETTDKWRSLVLDAKGAYKDRKLKHYRRVFLLYGDKAALVLDDIKTEAKHAVQCHYQCGHAAKVLPDLRSAVIEGKETSLLVKTFGPNLQLNVEGPLDFGRSWVFAQSHEFSWHRLTGSFSFSQNTSPLVTVFLPFDRSASVPQCEASYNPDRITVTLPGGMTAEFLKEAAGWRFVKNRRKEQ